MRKHIIYLVLSIFVVTLSCNSSGDDTQSSIQTLHEDYYDVNIWPTLNNFKTAIEKQIAYTETFKTDTSIENFNNLQKQWLESAKLFSKTKAYNLVAVKAKFFDIQIYNFPISASLIETNITEQTTFNASYFSSQSTVSKGLGTLEYILYNEQNSDTAFSLLQNNSYRVDYLLGVSEEILNQIEALINFWESGYKNTFINATDISCTNNSRCLAFNQLINILDVIRVTKLGKPAGLEGSNTTSLTSLEAYRSKSSLELMKSSIEEVQQVYTLSAVKFSNLVDDISDSTEISDAIDNAFSNVYSNMDAIDSNLYDAIENSDPNVELLYDSLFDLVKYFSVDAASILSVTVLPTDNDGD